MVLVIEDEYYLQVQVFSCGAWMHFKGFGWGYRCMAYAYLEVTREAGDEGKALSSG